MAAKERSPGKHVSYDGVDYDVVREGLAEILNPVQPSKEVASNEEGKSQPQSVFYNPIQQFNRDLSVLAIRVFAEQLVQTRNQRHGKRRHGEEKHGQKRKREDNQIQEKATNGISKEPEKSAEIGSADVKEALVPNTTLDTEMKDALTQHDLQPVAAEQLPNSNGAGSSTIPSGPKIPSKDRLPPPIRVLDALSASGLRALRYAQEISALTHVVANDLSLLATKAIDVNVKHNKQESKISLNTGDAIDFMSKSKGKFEVVDLDPYGTAGPFLDAAIQSLTSGGLLCVTCTDSAVFAAAGYCEKTFAVYGGMPIKGPHSHEGGLRLLLHAIATTAARYGLAIEPLLSLSIDFYIRVFVKVRKSPQEVKFLSSKSMVVYGCDSGCGSWTTQRLARAKENVAKNGTPYYTFSLAQAPSVDSSCPHCGFTTHLHGPMWGGPIHNPFFIESMLDTLKALPEQTYGTKPRMEGMLITARDETLLSTSTQSEPSTENRLSPQTIDHHPFFFLPSAISGALHCVAPSSAQIRGALLHLGYRVTRSHAKPGSVKTDAPWSVIWEVMREWIRQHNPVKEDNIKPGSPARAILDKRRDRRDNLSGVREELKALGSNLEAHKDDVKTKLESILFRLSHNDLSTDDVNGEEENGPIATDKKLPVHKLKIVFDEQLGKKSEENEGKRLVRYQLNPRANWGPMSKAKG